MLLHHQDFAFLDKHQSDFSFHLINYMRAFANIKGEAMENEGYGIHFFA